MKKICVLIGFVFALLFACANLARAAEGVCVLTATELKDIFGEKKAVVLSYACTGNTTTGAVPDYSTDVDNAARPGTKITDLIRGTRLVSVRAFPTPEGSAPGAAGTITVNYVGNDVLGGKGANLIPTTGSKEVFPYNTISTTYFEHLVTGILTLTHTTVAGNAGKNWTIEEVFER